MQNREIKFRAWWDKEGMEYYENWGDIRGLARYMEYGDVEKVMQYTGLKDKNGKEIYEGDIVRYPEGVHHWSDGFQGNIVVAYEDGSFYPFCGCGGEYCVSPEHVNIVGNTHENPELL